jgi:hypothetical protein
LLNDGSPTLISNVGTLTVPDLTIAHNSIARILDRCALPNIKGIDHMPIGISRCSNPVTQTPYKKISRFDEKSANWELYKNIITKSLETVQLPKTPIKKPPNSPK